MKKRKTLFTWIWNSYARTAIIPLIVIELVFVGIYFTSNQWIKNKNQEANYKEAQQSLQSLVDFEAREVQQQLKGVAYLTESYRRQVGAVLSQQGVQLAAEDRNRLAYSPEGTYYTTKDLPTGGAAIFYSGYVPVGEKEREKVAKLLPMQNLMKNLQESHPLVASIYFNTNDSLNIIYPYFNVLEQYPTKINTSTYNFYYEADEVHNPKREVTWTDVYLDPAGHGWMTSSLAPVYQNDTLAGVVGLDITVDTIINSILDVDIPWEGYPVLVGRDGTILALPPKGEGAWGLDELTTHEYEKAIMQDTKKPDEFNIYKRKDAADLASSLQKNEKGVQGITLAEQRHVISWASIPETNWKLMVIVQEKQIYEEINSFNQSLNTVGQWMVISLICFYLLFFAWLYRRAKVMSENIAKPLSFINTGLQHLADEDSHSREFTLQSYKHEVEEINETVSYLGAVGAKLGQTRTGLVLAKEELQQRENYLQSLVSSIEDIILELDTSGKILNVLVQKEERLLLPKDEMIGKSIVDFVDEETVKAFEETLAEIEPHHSSDLIEFYLSKTSRWYQARLAFIMRNEGEQPETISAVIRDVTKRKQAELALKESEARKSAMQEAALDGIIIMNAEGIILEFNPAAEKIFQYPRDYAIGRPMAELITPVRYRQQHLEGMKRYLAGGAPKIIGSRREVTAMRADLSEFPMELSVVKIDSKGPPVFTAYVRDITKEKEDQALLIQAKEDAEKANVAKSKFLSSISHELRTPLNAILGFAQILEFDPFEPLTEGQKESVDEIQKAGNHLLKLIDEILDLTKIESGNLPVQIEAIAVGDIIEESLSLIAPLAQARSIILHYNRGENPYFVESDRTRAKQVLLNILSNAVKYNRENGEIHVFCKQLEHNIEISIRDTGLGIAPGELERIFEPFYRNDHAKRFIEGTGIGLSVTKQLIELMRGSITVKSKEGEGSTFSITMPISRNIGKDE